MQERGSSDVKCAYEWIGERGREEGRSPSRGFFRASPLICPPINLGKRGRSSRDFRFLLRDPVASSTAEGCSSSASAPIIPSDSR